MQNTIIITLILATMLFLAPANAEEVTMYDFEKGAEGWLVPPWSCEKDSYVCDVIMASYDAASTGNSSLKLVVDFPGGVWYGAIIEAHGPFNLTAYKGIACDILLPSNVVGGALRARYILSIGDDWEWIEGSRTINLKPGEWVTLSTNLLPGSYDWRRKERIERKMPDGNIIGYVEQDITIPITDAFREDIRSIALRIEADRAVYDGPIYVDNVRLVK